MPLADTSTVVPLFRKKVYGVDKMPYAVKGNTVVKKDTGEVVGHSRDPEQYIRVLRAVEHGWKPGKKKNKYQAAAEKE